MYKPAVILHIGTHKTGSSALQRFFTRNKQALLNKGIFWIEESYFFGGDLLRLKSSDHINIFPDNIQEQINSALRSDKTIIFSSEGFSGSPSYGYRNTESIAKTLCKLLGNLQVKVVVYLRRQDLFYESWYTQKIHEGGNKLFIQFWEDFAFRNLDWEQVLKAYANTFGESNMIVRPYVKEQLKKGDIIHDFMSLLDITQLEDLDNNFTSDGRNDSMSHSALKVARHLNGILTDKNQKHNLRVLLQATHAKKPFGKHGYLTQEQRKEILTHFEDFNEVLCNKWFGLESNIFTYMEASNEQIRYVNIDNFATEDLAEVTMQSIECEEAILKALLSNARATKRNSDSL